MRTETMSGKQRTLKAIRHEEADRVPLNIWMFRDDVRGQVVAKYGSLERFYEALRIDVFMAITPPPSRHNPDFLEQKMTLSLEELSASDLRDPDDPALYEEVKGLVDRYGADKCVLAHTWGVLEGAYSFMGVEETLAQLALWPPKLQWLFETLSGWSARIAQNVVDLGIDVLHISSDVGANNTMILSRRTWRDRIVPYDSRIIAPGLRRGLPISLHSCGYVKPVIGDLLDLGIDVIHPLQQSAGMNLAEVKRAWGGRLTIHGGLELRYYLSRAPEEELAAHVRDNMLACKPGGGFIFNTEHTVQPDTTLERVELAYRTALEHSWYG